MEPLEEGHSEVIPSSDGAFTAGSDDNAKLSTSDHDEKLSTNLVSLISHKSQSDSSSQSESDSSSIRTVSMSQKSLQVTPPVKSKGMPFIYFSQIIIFSIKNK